MERVGASQSRRNDNIYRRDNIRNFNVIPVNKDRGFFDINIYQSPPSRETDGIYL